VSSTVRGRSKRSREDVHIVNRLIFGVLAARPQRVPLKSADAFAAFTGLDPRPDDSGQHRGKRRLSKRGPAELRRLLYMAAMSAVKTKTWKPLYERYRAKGLSGTATLVILARRIARSAWSMHTHQTTFDAERLTEQPSMRNPAGVGQ
jgi:transposase